MTPRLDSPENSLDEVNATRANRGLAPFIYNDGLARGAKACADYRAEHLMAGHTRNDFAYLPEGVHAQAAGCAAWPPDMGWGACCTYERWRYCGAAYAIGRDGRRYMHLFVADDLSMGSSGEVGPHAGPCEDSISEGKPVEGWRTFKQGAD